MLTGCRPDVAVIQPDCGQCDDAHRRDTTRRIAAGNQLAHVATPVQDRINQTIFARERDTDEPSSAETAVTSVSLPMATRPLPSWDFLLTDHCCVTIALMEANPQDTPAQPKVHRLRSVTARLKTLLLDATKKDFWVRAQLVSDKGSRHGGPLDATSTCERATGKRPAIGGTCRIATKLNSQTPELTSKKADGTLRKLVERIAAGYSVYSFRVVPGRHD